MEVVISKLPDQPVQRRARVLAEIARVLRCGVSDLVDDDNADPSTLSEAAASVGATTGVGSIGSSPRSL